MHTAIVLYGASLILYQGILNSKMHGKDDLRRSCQMMAPEPKV